MMERGGIIYLDNAATSFPKPRSVTEEVRRALTQYGGNPGRGAHRLSLEAAEKIFECRTLAAKLFGVDDPARICFSLNTTQALNTVIKGTLRKGDHVLISDLEHNAVYRPIWKLAREGIISYDVFPSMATDPKRNAARICGALAKRCRPNTRMVICTCASNLCSVTMPIREIGAFCHRHGILFVADGAQAAGHMPISVDGMALDALCVPGHKGLLGPQGCGVTVLGKDFLPDSLYEGGNGVDSLEGFMPPYSPERLEAGTLPTPAIAGVAEGLKWLLAVGVDTVEEYEKTLYRKARELLGNMEGVEVYAPLYEGATLLFNVKNLSSEVTAARLDEMGICTRGGYHCAALGHKTLGTPEGGAVRVGIGPFNTENQMIRLADAVYRITTESI